MNKKFKIRKEDTVQVIAGKDKGKRGSVVRILRDKDRVIVLGLNMVKKAMRRKNQQDRGGIVEIEAPIHTSNMWRRLRRSFSRKWVISLLCRPRS